MTKTLIVEVPPAVVVDAAPMASTGATPLDIGPNIAAPDGVRDSNLTPAQHAHIAALTAEVHTLVHKDLGANRDRAKVVDAPIVKKLAEMFGLLHSVEGAGKEAWTKLNMFAATVVWAPFIDVVSTPEERALTVAQVYKGEISVAATVTANLGLKQRLMRWSDVGRFEANLFKPGKPAKNGKPATRGEIAPVQGVTIMGVRYEKPSDALLAGNSFESVYQGWLNVVRPRIVDLDALVSDTAKAALYRMALEQSGETSVILREKQLVNGVKRWQKARRYADHQDAAKRMPLPALLGLTSGLMAIAAKRGIPKADLDARSIEILNSKTDDDGDDTAAA